MDKLLMQNSAATRLRMEGNVLAEDIRRYINHPIKQEHNELTHKDENSEKISLLIPKIQQNFLLASLVRKVLRTRRSVLGEIEMNFDPNPKDLDAIFNRTLGAIYHSHKSQKEDSSFSWL
jgi:hypothetical protein